MKVSSQSRVTVSSWNSLISVRITVVTFSPAVAAPSAHFTKSNRQRLILTGLRILFQPSVAALGRAAFARTLPSARADHAGLLSVHDYQVCFRWRESW